MKKELIDRANEKLTIKQTPQPKEWICPNCGVKITGPSYPKLHTCQPEQDKTQPAEGEISIFVKNTRERLFNYGQKSTWFGHDLLDACDYIESLQKQLDEYAQQIADLCWDNKEAMEERIKELEQQLAGLKKEDTTEIIQQIEEERIKQRDAHRAKIRQLEQQLARHRWIPVSERLPEIPDGNKITSEFVLVYNGNSKCCEVAYYNYERKKWEGELPDPTYWKPIILPEEKEITNESP